MQYVIFVEEEPDGRQLLAAPVAPEEVAFLRTVRPHLRHLSDDEYVNGPMGVLSTMAKHSYVLDGDELIWCVEWDPGLLVVVLSSSGEMRWAAVRSPAPDFGGRKAEPAELAAYDEDQHNPQYELVFTPWDAQFEEDHRKWHSFEPADDDVSQRFRAAVAHTSDLQVPFPDGDSEVAKRWSERAVQNLKHWCGEGVRLS